MACTRVSMLHRTPALAATVLAALAMLAPAARADVTPDLYPLPAGVTAGSAIVAAPDGVVWFATGDSVQTPRIGRVDRATATSGTANGITFFTTPTFTGAPCCATFVRSLAFDAGRDRLWFTRSDGAYGFGTTAQMSVGTSGGMSFTHLPTSLDLMGVAVDPASGAAWLAETSSSNVETPSGSHYYPGDRIASTDSSLAVVELPNIAQQGGSPTLSDQRYDAQPQGVAYDGNGGVWFAEGNAGLPGYRISHTVAGAYQEYLIQPCVSANPCSGSYTGSGPTSVALATDGSVWFTNQANNSIGRLDPSALTFTQYSLASIDPTLAGGRPMQIRAASDGTLWLAEYGGTVSNTGSNAIVRIVPTPGSPTATVYKTGNGAPLAVAPSATGDVWFTLTTASSPSYLGRLADVVGGTVGPGGGTNPLTPPSPGPTTAPVGITTAPAGTVTLVPSAVGVAKVGIVSANGDTVSVRQICVGPPQDKCSVIYELDANEYVAGFPGTKERAVGTMAKAKAKKIPFPVLGRLSASLRGGQTKTLKIRLTAKARKALKRAGSIKATLVVTQTVNGGKPKVIQRKKLTFKAKKTKKTKKTS